MAACCGPSSPVRWNIFFTRSGSGNGTAAGIGFAAGGGIRDVSDCVVAPPLRQNGAERAGGAAGLSISTIMNGFSLSPTLRSLVMLALLVLSGSDPSPCSHIGIFDPAL
jgi:hypothetical protein